MSSVTGPQEMNIEKSRRGQNKLGESKKRTKIHW